MQGKLSFWASVFFFLGCSLLVYSQQPTQRQPPIESAVIAPALRMGEAFRAVSEHVKPAVVSVYSQRTVNRSSDVPLPFGEDFFRRFFGDDFGLPPGHPLPPGFPPGPVRGMGSGVILNESGAILTNFHVVQGFDEITVQLANRAEYSARILGSDPQSDVAVLQLKGKIPEGLPTATLGDSDKLQVGDITLAIGAPFGLPQTVTQGIISATGRANVGIADFEDFIQTDTPINPGNSGGPLVNMRGEVIGINSAIATSVGQSAGVGFSIPINMVKAMLPKLLKGESITRGQLGVVIQDLTMELARQFGMEQSSGVLVAEVVPQSPASEAGLKTGDVIVGLDEKDISNAGQLRNLVAATEPGKQVILKVIRNGKTQEFRATIAKLEDVPSPTTQGGAQEERLGLAVQNLPEEVKSRLKIHSGVIVSELDPSGPAAQAGILMGDVITQVDRKAVRNVNTFRQLVKAAKDKKSILLLVNRDGTNVFVVVKFP